VTSLEGLRRKQPYRAYIRGLRWFLIFACGFPLTVLLGYLGVISHVMIAIFLITFLLAAAVSIMTAFVSWLPILAKNRPSSQSGLSGAILHDVFVGLPSDGSGG
jgi:hypothetical protein